MGRFKYIPLFWTSLGVFLFTFKFYFITSYIGSLWSNFFFIFGILSFIFSFYVKGSQVVLPFAGVLRYIYVFYLLWSVLVIVRASVEGAPIEWNMLIYQPDYFWQYWIPFILLFGIRYLNFKDVKCILILSMLVGMFYIILNWEEIFFTSHLNLYNSFIAEEVRKGHVASYFIIPAGIILLCQKFYSNKLVVFTILLFLLGSVNAALYARRSTLFFYFFFLLSGLLIYVKKENLVKLLWGILVIIGICLILMSSFDWESYLVLLLDKLDKNTRSGVEMAFYKDMSWMDWIIGRGMTGTYYCWEVSDIDRLNRLVIETGYLNIILKGGIFLLLPYVFFCIKSFFLGYFKSKNMLTKGMGVYCLAYVFFLYPSGTPEFNLSWVILWISILYCNTSSIRYMSDEQIRNKYF